MAGRVPSGGECRLDIGSAVNLSRGRLSIGAVHLRAPRQRHSLCKHCCVRRSQVTPGALAGVNNLCVVRQTADAISGAGSLSKGVSSDVTDVPRTLES